MKKSLLLAAMLLSVAVSANATDFETVSYIDADGNQQTVSAAPITYWMDDDVAEFNGWQVGFDLKSGWFVVNGDVSTFGPLITNDANGPVNIILADDCCLHVDRLLMQTDANIYVQSKGNGKIQTSDMSALYPGSPTINIYGGTLSGELYCNYITTMSVYNADITGYIGNDGGSMLIENSIVTNTAGPALVNNGNCVINSGTFTGAEYAFQFGENNIGITLAPGTAWFSDGVKVELETKDIGDHYTASTLASYTVKDDVSTGINGVKVEGSKAVKTIENGKLVITKDGKRYNAAGQLMK